MKISKQMLLVLPAVVLAGALFVAPVVYARDGVEDNSTSTSTGTQTESATHEQEVARESAKQQAESLREKAKQDVEKRREAQKDELEKNKQEREHKCESHKQGLETKVASLNTNAQKHLDHFKSAYAKALQYQKDNNLNPDGFAALVTAADAAQVKAEASVAALNDLKPTIDCNKDSTASDVAAFKAAATQARTDLNAYKKAVKAVFTSLVQAQEATKPAGTESENQ